MQAIMTQDSIAGKILLIRGCKVILDVDLAELYGVSTKALNQAVKRNKARFPEDFMFCLSKQEKEEVVTNCDHLEKLKFSPYLPYAFTEHGALMLANVLNSKRAAEVSILIIRVFIKLREMLSSHKELASKITQLEFKVESHDKEIHAIFSAIRKLMVIPKGNKRKIGFK